MLIGVLGLLTSAASRVLSDTLTFAINLAVNTNLIQFVHGTTTTSRADVTPPVQKWGPFYMITFASLASMADLTKQVFLDANSQVLSPGDGSDATSFDFTQCVYTAVAAPLPGTAGDVCSAAPMDVKQLGALGGDSLEWLNGDYATSLCANLGWAGLIFTVVGFMWLSEVVPWLKQRWDYTCGKSLEKPLLC